MVKSLMVGVFGCLEYAIVFLFIASLAFTLTQGLDILIPEVYDYSAEDELTKVVREGFESKQITSQESLEILQIYRDDQTGLQRLRSYILYAVSICISAAVSVLLFKKYRSLRFRERFRDYFFPPKT
jgi:hypothetical protein